MWIYTAYVVRYRYTKLRVSCLEVREYAVGEMRAAVGYLRTVPQTGFTGLVAVGETVDAGPFKLGPTPMLQLSEIVGRTPAEVWELFDQQIDRDREGLIRRAAGWAK
ncbi:MAG: hypothetical protein ACJ73D_04040 [Pyrinomonadaceae bacterium]